MLKIHNNDITTTLGESVTLRVSVVDKSGKPYILPSIKNLIDAWEKDPTKPEWPCGTYAVFTVRSGLSGDIVLEKFMDLQEHPVYNGVIDEYEYGYNKFTTQTVQKVSALPLAQLQTEVYEVDGVYYACCKTGSTSTWAQYEFSIGFNLDNADFSKLDSKEYTYDINLYIGKLQTDSKKQFPLGEIYWKRTVISPHRFILEDTYNG